MSDLMEKLKKAAMKAGLEGAKNPSLLKAAMNIKETVDAFKAGYHKTADPIKHKTECPHCHEALPPKAKYCPNCGAKVD